jgi:hypothetical protein
MTLSEKLASASGMVTRRDFMLALGGVSFKELFVMTWEVCCFGKICGEEDRASRIRRIAKTDLDSRSETNLDEPVVNLADCTSKAALDKRREKCHLRRRLGSSFPAAQVEKYSLMMLANQIMSGKLALGPEGSGLQAR